MSIIRIFASASLVLLLLTSGACERDHDVESKTLLADALREYEMALAADPKDSGNLSASFKVTLDTWMSEQSRLSEIVEVIYFRDHETARSGMIARSDTASVVVCYRTKTDWPGVDRDVVDVVWPSPLD